MRTAPNPFYFQVSLFSNSTYLLRIFAFDCAVLASTSSPLPLFSLFSVAYEAPSS
jgi:hypothetical protein